MGHTRLDCLLGMAHVCVQCWLRLRVPAHKVGRKMKDDQEIIKSAADAVYFMAIVGGVVFFSSFIILIALGVNWVWGAIT